MPFRYLQIIHHETLPMKAPVILLLIALFFTACVTPSNDGGENQSSDQGEWNSKLPASFFEQGEESLASSGVTNLRNPSRKDPLSNGDEEQKKIYPQYHSQYNFLRADRTLTLPAEMSDIAGLSLSPDGYSLIALNYKDGDIHYIDKWRGDYEYGVRFKHRGRYEGIEAVRNDVFIVKENGSIVHVSELDSEKPKTKTFNTPLNAKFAVQGLTYHPIRNELLLACQGNDGDRAFDDSESIYVFDLDSKELFRQPMFLIEDQAIFDYLNQQRPPLEEGDELFYKPPTEKPFEPSAIAIHPRTDELFLISASSMLLVILSEDGDLLHAERLDPFLFTEPEGMCFDLDGTLYISSKGGRGSTGKIHLFSPQFRNRHPS